MVAISEPEEEPATTKDRISPVPLAAKPIAGLSLVHA